MGGIPRVARGIARIVAGISMGLAISSAAGGAEQDSIASQPSGLAWGGNGGTGGGFRVTPTRVVFEGPLRSAELTLANTGSEPATYRVSLVRMRMTEAGAIVEVEDALPGESFADSMLRFSPRQVELEPGATQTVRMQLRKPANLSDGEYRSHLVFRALPPVEPDDSPGGRPPSTRGVSIALRPVFGAAIPVIVRQGETAATVTIRVLELRRGSNATGEPLLALEMSRTGNRSVYGDLTVTWTPPGGRPRNVGGMRGLAVYTPNLVRRVLVPLRNDPKGPWMAGTLRVAFEEVAGERELLAEAELALP